MQQFQQSATTYVHRGRQNQANFKGKPAVVTLILFPYPSTWADLDETVVLDENGVTGEVAVDDGRLAGVQVTAETKTGQKGS